ncbi:MAG: peptide deformylase [Candidatus Omnitrophica bacterium]|nr:peptide deformylase [Candidatus Omnitrophota bacterium]
MKKLRLRYLGDPILRKKARKLDKVTPSVRETVEAMWDLMEQSKGIGLEAPQAGLSQRIIVVDTREDGEQYALINPEIVWASDVCSPLSEGCLSIPGVEAEVIRPSHVRVKGSDIQGKEIEIEAKDLLAKVMQHEIDHLNGVLFIDRLEDREKEKIQPELDRFEAPVSA